MAKFTWEHVHLRSPDPEATAQWYHDKLGADVIRTKNADGSTRIDLNLSGQKVFIAMADPAKTGAPPASPYLGLDHFGMTVDDLCAAIVEASDNGGANLLLERVGGPKGLTRFLRESGDAVTRLDRNEPSLNSNLPDDPRDTTTPDAMVGTMKRILTGDVLQPASRDKLLDWLRKSETGAKRLRAGLPAGWDVGDKTGTGIRGATVDNAIVWPPGRARRFRWAWRSMPATASTTPPCDPSRPFTSWPN